MTRGPFTPSSCKAMHGRYSRDPTRKNIWTTSIGQIHPAGLQEWANYYQTCRKIVCLRLRRWTERGVWRSPVNKHGGFPRHAGLLRHRRAFVVWGGLPTPPERWPASVTAKVIDRSVEDFDLRKDDDGQVCHEMERCCTTRPQCNCGRGPRCRQRCR